MQLIDHLKWRYATKKFDPSSKIPAADLQQLQEAIQLSASSFGLQLYKVLLISDPVLREALRAVSWGQAQITDASHLVVFCHYTQVDDTHVDEYLQLTSRMQSVDIGLLADYGTLMKNMIARQSITERHQWTARQTYLALGTLLAACAELRIDACPMEGFDAAAYDRILGLTEQGLHATVIATIGYRSGDDVTAKAIKVRRPLEQLFELR
ncbi:NAD(P)H-dependent oxidoreductase [Chitinophaga pendula]|uniref:NAD(P)H-dependent oxidoreductase n=1 Tax=Chitinophaga TaxID=79328 RepID=UPI000BB0B455|nr:MULTISPECIES: NAD(P)H-dependent oxidoreductase [Chitinophaga]ASZ14087.1 NAD(P)H-dependent oxidoreductase [Chitinophaga sp. MD30]UCJ08280.1 NAD(P)H-dependent oxidoreductase [Chitinophaga pendula]